MPAVVACYCRNDKTSKPAWKAHTTSYALIQFQKVSCLLVLGQAGKRVKKRIAAQKGEDRYEQELTEGSLR